MVTSWSEDLPPRQLNLRVIPKFCVYTQRERF